MRYLVASRESLLSMLDGSFDLRMHSREAFDLNELLLPRDDLTFCWSDTDEVAGHPLPTAIIGANKAIEDLIAWSATYLRNVSPLTSYIRVIDVDIFRQYYMKNSRLEGLRHIQAAMLGAIIGEVCAQSRQILALDSISLAACYSTLSFAILRSSYVGYGIDVIDEVPARWSRARKILDQRSSSLELKSPLTAITRLIEQYDVKTPVFPLFDQAKTDKSMIDIGVVDLLMPGAIQPYKSVLEQMQKLSAEDRVHHFEDAARNAVRNGKKEASFDVAVLAACCRPGSLSTMKLLSQFLPDVPDAPVWFGLMQGLMAGQDFLNIANGLGLRIFRDLIKQEDIVSRPKSDIQFEELLIFGRSHSGVRPIRSEMKGRVVVDILPGVPVIIPVSERRSELDIERTRDSYESQQSLFERNQWRRNEIAHISGDGVSRIENMLKQIIDQLDLLRHVSPPLAEPLMKRKPRKTKNT